MDPWWPSLTFNSNCFKPIRIRRSSLNVLDLFPNGISFVSSLSTKRKLYSTVNVTVFFFWKTLFMFDIFSKDHFYNAQFTKRVNLCLRNYQKVLNLWLRYFCCQRRERIFGNTINSRRAPSCPLPSMLLIAPCFQMKIILIHSFRNYYFNSDR